MFDLLSYYDALYLNYPFMDLERTLAVSKFKFEGNNP